MRILGGISRRWVWYDKSIGPMTVGSFYEKVVKQDAWNAVILLTRKKRIIQQPVQEWMHGVNTFLRDSYTKQNGMTASSSCVSASRTSANLFFNEFSADARTRVLAWGFVRRCIRALCFVIVLFHIIILLFLYCDSTLSTPILTIEISHVEVLADIYMIEPATLQMIRVTTAWNFLLPTNFWRRVLGLIDADFFDQIRVGITNRMRLT